MRRPLAAIALVVSAVAVLAPGVVAPTTAFADHGTDLSGPPDENGNWGYCDLNIGEEQVPEWEDRNRWTLACQYGPTSARGRRVEVELDLYNDGVYETTHLQFFSLGGSTVTIPHENEGGKAAVTKYINAPFSLDPKKDYDYASATCEISVRHTDGSVDVGPCGISAARGGTAVYPIDHWPGGTRGGYWPGDREKPVNREQLYAACVNLLGEANPLLGDWAINPAVCLSDPVNTGLGAFEDADTDAAVPGPGPGIEFTRVYTSADTATGALGQGWTHVYNASLDLSALPTVTFRTPSGQQIEFTDNGDGTYTGDQGARSTLTTAGSGFEVIRNSDNLTMAFDSAGRLTGIRDRNNEGVDLAYDATTEHLTHVTDTAGQTVAFTTDTSGKITQLTLPDTRTVSYGYTGDLLTSVTDAAGNTTQYEYDTGGRLARVIDPLGNTLIDNTYNTAGRVTAQTDAEGNSSSFAASTSDGMVHVEMTDALGNIWTDTYQDNVLRHRTEPLGNETAVIYDEDLNQPLFADPAGTWRMTYDDSGNLLSRSDPTGATTTWTYDTSHRPLTRTDPNGGVTTLTYDTAGNVETVTDPEGAITTLAYDADGNVTAVTDPAGETTSLVYDTAGRLTKATDPLGNATTYGYDTAGRLTSTTNPLGDATTFAYNNADLLTSRTDPLGNTTGYSYDAAGRVTQVADPAGGTTDYTYNAAGEVTQVTDAAGATTAYEYDARGQLTKATDPLGNATTYAYDPARRLSAVTDAAGATTSHSYDAAGRLTATTDPLGNTTSYGYDPAGRLTSTTDPLGNVEALQYDPAGRLVAETDPLGNTTSHAYDAAGRRTSTTDPLGDTTTQAYDARGLLSSVTDPAGATTAYAYDAAGQLTGTTDPLGNATSYGYDAAGRRVTVTDPGGDTTTSAYDAAGQLTSQTDPLGNVTTFVYDALGRRTSRTDANGHTTTWSYDAAGRITTVTAPGGTTTSYGYDAAGRRTSRTDANGHTTTWSYDPVGREVARVSDLGATRTTEYDLAGNITREISAAGNATADPEDGITDYTHDPAGQLTAIDYSDEATYSLLSFQNVVDLEVSIPTPDITFTYDPAGRRVEMTDGQGTETYTYDDAGRLTRIARGDTSIEYAYDPAGRATTRDYPTATLAYGYDQAGRLTSVDDGDATTSYTYDAEAQLTRTDHPNGTVETRTYDAAGRTLTIDTPGVDSYQYTYDPAGNPTRVDRGADVETYAYDARDQLLEACYDTACGDFIRYQYDPVGNRTQETRPGSSTTYSYDADDRLTQIQTPTGTVDYDHDPDGQVTTAGDRHFAYDGAGHLVAHVDTTTPFDELLVEQFAYDGNDNRVSAATHTATSTVTNRSFLWDPTFTVDRLISEHDDETAGSSQFVWGQGLAWWAHNDNTDTSPDTSTPVEGRHVAHQDRIGSISAITADDGSVEGIHTYEPFGTERDSPLADDLLDEFDAVPLPPLDGTDQPFRFAGEYLEDTTGLYNLQARNYNPDTGRFTARDPLDPLAEEPAISPYLYANNRPTAMTDPTGLRAQALVQSVADAVGKDPLDLTLRDVFEVLGGGRSGRGGGPVLGTPVVAPPVVQVLIEALVIEVIAGDGVDLPNLPNLPDLPGPLPDLPDLPDLPKLPGAGPKQDEDRDSRKVVIGESARRTSAAAAAFGAETWSGAEPGSSHAQVCASNRAWINAQMAARVEVIDIGIDSSRVGSRSPYYELERRELDGAGYPINRRPWPASPNTYRPPNPGPCP